MLKLMLLTVAMIMADSYGPQPRVAHQQNEQIIPIGLYNNRPWPYQGKLISYSPGNEGNSARTFWLLPFTTKYLRFAAGTQLYLANQQQIDTVMQGNKLVGAPWHIVTANDRNTKINLH